MLISSILGKIFTAQGKRREKKWINSRESAVTHMHTRARAHTHTHTHTHTHENKNIFRGWGLSLVKECLASMWAAVSLQR